MSDYRQTNVYTNVEENLRSYILHVFTKMGLGLALTAGVAYFGYISLESGNGLVRFIFENSWILIALLFLQLGLCIGLSAGLNKLSPTMAGMLFYAYAAITGITFSTLPYVYGYTTIFTAFLFAAVLFGCCVIIGYTTKVDLSQFQGILMGGLLAMVVTTIISIFVPVLRDSLVISYIGVILFLTLTAYDMQKIKAFYYQTDNYDLRENLSTYSAFQLYLDFINLFLYILRILGRRNRN